MERQRVWISKDGIEEFGGLLISLVLWYLSWNALIGSVLQKKLHNL